MASKRRIRRQAAKHCVQKRKFETREEAERSLAYLRSERDAMDSLHVYQCGHCRKYHLGHYNTNRVLSTKTSHMERNRYNVTEVEPC